MHDSSARDPPPRCHPDTREAALDTIDAFVEEPEPDKAVMWMNAPFGHGKSAVMQTAIETLRASGRGEQVGGGFFFGRDKEGRDKPHYLLPTILYQIAHNIPGMYEHVNNAINTDPTLPSKSIEAQLIPLLVTPFLHHYPQSTRTPTIFIDGLDECDTPAAQRSVLKMIADAVSVHHVPLRFVVASRPETHIAQYLKTSLLSSITRSFELDNDSWSMQSYFRKEFDRIYESRLDGLSAIPKPRPSDQVVRDLVCRACGQYLFASTIIRFVDDEYENPEEQLKVLLTSHPRQSPAFSSMDILYSQILSVCPTRLQSNLIDILGLINLEGAIPISGVADLLDLPPSDVVTIIRSLRSILDIGDLPTLPPHNTRFSLSSYLSPNISIRHTSLREFLSDKARAGGFWVDLDITQAKLLERSDFVLSSSISDSASSMIIHPATWKCLLRPGWSRQTGGLNASDWPRFSREFSKYQATSSPRCPPAGCRLQCSKAFCYLLGIWNKHSWIMDQIASPEDFHIVQSLVATSLRECFHSLTQESLDLFALLKYFHLTEKSTYATTLEAIANQPDISFDVALRAIDSASIFFTLETDKYYTKPSFRDVSICVDWSIMEILMDSNLIGEDIYIAHRNARILALSDCYNSLLQEIPSSDSFRRKASSVFDLPQITWDILMLKDNTDNGSGSTMEAFINRICSPRSLAVLCNSAAFDYSTSYFFVPFFFFVTTNCVEASILGECFKGIHSKLNDLITTLLQTGALAAVFSHLDRNDATMMMQSQSMTIYRNISRMERFSQGQWLDLVDDKTHTMILGFFLGPGLMQMFYKQEPYPWDIPWLDHFSRASASLMVTSYLVCLNYDGPTFKNVGPLLPESFALSVKMWKEKHLAGDPENAQELDELCLELSSMGRSSILREHEISDAPRDDGVGNDQNSNGVYADARKIDEESDEEYEDAVEELESKSEASSLSCSVILNRRT